MLTTPPGNLRLVPSTRPSVLALDAQDPLVLRRAEALRQIADTPLELRDDRSLFAAGLLASGLLCDLSGEPSALADVARLTANELLRTIDVIGLRLRELEARCL